MLGRGSSPTRKPGDPPAGAPRKAGESPTKTGPPLLRKPGDAAGAPAATSPVRRPPPSDSAARRPVAETAAPPLRKVCSLPCRSTSTGAHTPLAAAPRLSWATPRVARLQASTPAQLHARLLRRFSFVDWAQTLSSVLHPVAAHAPHSLTSTDWLLYPTAHTPQTVASSGTSTSPTRVPARGASPTKAAPPLSRTAGGAPPTGGPALTHSTSLVTQRDGGGEGGGGGAPTSGPAAPLVAPTLRGPIRPREQVVLSEDALAEEFTKSLTADNPNAPSNMVRFNHKERTYKLEPMVDHLAVHLSRDGHKIHKDSEEAARQAAAAAARAAEEAEEAQRLREALGEAVDADEEGEEEEEGKEETEEAEQPQGEEKSALDEDNGEPGGGATAEEEAAAAAAAAAAAEAARAAAAAPVTPPQGAGGPPPVRFRNQFVFKERAMQTTNHASRDKAVATEPAPKMTFSGVCSRWQMYEWYLEDQRTQEKQRQLKEAVAKRTRGSDGAPPGGGIADAQAGGAAAVLASTSASGLDAMLAAEASASASAASVNPSDAASAVLANPAFARSAKLLERMVSQNSCREIADDFKYWDDASDALRPSGEGTLLPLWEFETPKGRKRTVTALVWHPTYADLFAVGYGSFDFMRPTGGAVACISLKCPNTPECSFDTPDAGVTALAFHPQHSSLLAVGLANGTVSVHDIRGGASGAGTPLFAANARSGKHDDQVWQLAWAPDLDAAASVAGGEAVPVRGPLTFFSVSGDGRVCQWTMTRAELTGQTVMELRTSILATAPPLPGDIARPGTAAYGGRPGSAAAAPAGAAPEEALLAGRVGGTALDLHPSGDGVYLVATEEGTIHKCSTAFSARVLATYTGHAMAVYSLQWNPFEPQVFLSGSADWSVKLWDSGSSRAVKSFDLGAAVGDAAWAPFSSTTFGATSADGRVHVFDLSVNKHEPLCRQKIVKKARLTKLAFNAVHPVLLAGDDRGTVTCLKLSPNLRKVPSQPAPEEETTLEAVQKQRLTRIVEQARKGESASVPGPRRTGGSRGAPPMATTGTATS